MPELKDLFSGYAEDYSRFRPNYPAELFEFLAGVAPARDLAWDAGTGNGQAAAQIAQHFKKVLATDLSEKQLSLAPRASNIEYRVATTESGLVDHSCDLVTVAQAFHWFQRETFYGVAKRVLKPKGVFAIWCYGNCTISPEVDTEVLSFYEGTLGKYWEPERKLVEQGFSTLQVPFVEFAAPQFRLIAEWDLKRFQGYLSTWSALKTAIKVLGRDPLEEFAPRLASAWGNAPSRKIEWPLSLRVFRPS